ncbi:pimeloyl-ACP methyl ester carboxylesterase [Clostridium tetanomorphum]|uniref:Alpha/beta hydrolase n=1 Tax=Clostridium tetanomorphum TaxID=1553 RepID=A0A923J1H9_CLOTT|nr:alpha/beta hydrolase [Clostridium tetanomorphum]KAJ49983.1 alpha/beta fold family hydrolase [Clostridium tetanomorphum DSM 665]MBC2398814.1 alpha/beta hydrolase [Clostridium tetanomorphum]MBP1863526.1 pimeloyl-ACP methyl ester carboxylesterase [Clostridium tetanomorphum]NRS83625.1 pimeloyl-ACP methyl ester carboxylesterase [Clostridium tetanomorphum]NRZ96819.1 pimeloyl-ACP methyl ester carboxylesterase [Clostridium tetanomorphum]
MKKILKLKPHTFLLVILILLIIGVIWQELMVNSEKNQYTAVGNHVDVGSYNAHYYTKGSGNTIFVFISGAGTPCAYTDYYYLQNELSKYGQTISFDHAGLGWSSKTNAKRDIDSITDELSIIINTVSKKNKVVLIAHSLGSLEAIRYTQRNSERVLGIVFLDAGSPEFYSKDSELKSFALNRTLAAFRVTGVNRLFGELDVLLPMYGESMRYKKLPQSVREIDKAMYYRYTGSYSNFKNIIYINENAEKVLDGKLLGNIPILILSSDAGSLWRQVQEQLARWSDNSQQIMIDNGAHYLYWSNTEDVIKYIDTFLKGIPIHMGL